MHIIDNQCIQLIHTVDTYNRCMHPGTVYAFPPDVPRVSVLIHLLRNGVPLTVYGPKHEWDALNISASPPSVSNVSIMTSMRVSGMCLL